MCQLVRWFWLSFCHG